MNYTNTTTLYTISSDFGFECHDMFKSIGIYYHNELIMLLVTIMALQAFLFIFIRLRSYYFPFYEKNITFFSSIISTITLIIIIYLMKR